MNNLYINANPKNTLLYKKLQLKPKNTIYIILALLMLMPMFNLSSFAANTDTPRVLMSEYVINDGTSETTPAGNFVLNFTLENPSGVGISNAILTYSQEKSNAIPVPGSANIAYIGDINAGGEYKGALEMNIPKTAIDGLCKIDISISYNSIDPTVHTMLTSNFSIYINIENNTEITIKKAELSDEETTNGSKSLIVEYENPGSQDFKNLKLFINGNVAEQQKNQALPILKSSKSNSIQYYVKFTQMGVQKIDLFISYEDDAGNTYQTPIISRSVNVSESTVQTMPAIDNKAEGTVSDLINKTKKFAKTPGFIVLCGILLVLTITIIIVVPKMTRKAKKKRWYYKNKDKKNDDQNDG